MDEGRKFVMEDVDPSAQRCIRNNDGGPESIVISVAGYDPSNRRCRHLPSRSKTDFTKQVTGG